MATELTTANTVGQREELFDKIDNITPVDTSFQKMCGKVSISNKRPQWQIDTLDAAVSTNAVIEGADMAAASMTPTVMQYNTTQILTKSVKVLGSVEGSTRAGRAKEKAYQMVKKAKELKRDLETSLLQNGAAVTGVPGSTAGKFKGIPCWVQDNLSIGTGTAGSPEAASGNGTAYAPAGPRALAQSQLTDVLQSCENAGGTPNVILSTLTHRSAMSAFTGVASSNVSNVDSSSGKIINTMKYFESDWGTLKFVPNRFLGTGSVYVLDDSDFDIMQYRPTFTKDAGVKGDYEESFMITEVSLKVGNWHKHGAIKDLS